MILFSQAADPLEGFDATDGNHPQFTRVDSNVIREIGIYEKQSGWIFQACRAHHAMIPAPVLARTRYRPRLEHS